MMWKNWTAAGAAGAVAGFATGVVATYAQHGEWQLKTVLVFSILTLPVWIGLAGLLWVPRVAPPEHTEDSVEVQWRDQAASEAFFDVMIALGLSTAMTNIVGIASVPSMLFVALGMADWFVRYGVPRRREG